MVGQFRVTATHSAYDTFSLFQHLIHGQFRFFSTSAFRVRLYSDCISSFGWFAFITPGLTFDTNMTGMQPPGIEPTTL